MSEAAEEIVEPKEAEPVEISPSEQKAREAGWVPQEEWQGSPDEWVDYKDFNFRGELMSRISEQSSIINHLENKVSTREKAIEDLAALQQKIAEREYKKALADLKAQKAAALEEGDGAKVVELDEEISGLKENKPKAEEVVTPQVPETTPPEIAAWLQKPENQWYAKDDVMRSIADGISNNIMRKKPNITPSDLLKELDETIRREMPHKFPKTTQAVDDGTGEFRGKPQGKQKLPSFSSLSQEQQDIARRFEKLGVMTKKEYIEELVSTGDL